MKFTIAAVSLALAQAAPVYSPGAEGNPNCAAVLPCPELTCKPPFKWTSHEELGTCCPMCWSDIKTPEDRSWAEHLTGGIGQNVNADAIQCRDVYCPKLMCDESVQTHVAGNCCTSCPVGQAAGAAAASWQPVA